MNLTPEQLEQCRKEFEAKVSKWSFDLSKDNVGDYRSERADDAWIVWKSAWRPIPSVEEIENIIDKSCHPIDYNGCRGLFDSESEMVSQAIHRAFGGEE